MRFIIALIVAIAIIASVNCRRRILASLYDNQFSIFVQQMKTNPCTGLPTPRPATFLSQVNAEYGTPISDLNQKYATYLTCK
jgi:hypothetical protein